MKQEQAQAYPLSWPTWVKRTPAGMRREAKFGKSTWRENADGSSRWRSKNAITVAQAVERLQAEVDRLGGQHVVLSTNMALRLDGKPRSDRNPDDPGAALYFVLGNKPMCLPCDKWDRVADNICAIAKHIEALRGQERWGVGTVEQAFAGYEALPAPDIDWRSVLQLHRAEAIDRAAIKAAYERLAKERHPDKPSGSHAMMAELNRARDMAIQEIPA